ncbi:MAG: dipeptidase [Balneolaceae bacterium]|nr:dipeptidase [Balneolaceae bacterium]MBO6545675.1 dipeptidase [Balneolaceae bacterium]MBO6647071.1 dipeptidase [Balneolaceae bacterium]
MKNFTGLLLILVLIALSSSACNNTNKELIEKARGIHDRVITLDTHADINTSNFTADRNYTQDLPTQVTLPKMVDGGLDVAWFIVYTGQDTLSEEGYAAAYENAIDKFDAIHRLVEEIAPDQIDLALTSNDVRRISAEGKLVAMIGVENAYPVATDLSRIEEFYNLGARYMSLAHNGHNQFSDSHTGEEDSVWSYNGISELGKEAIKEMNRLGIMIDISHPSKEANLQTMALSEAPVIASHSSARALNPSVSRSLSDEELMALKENGGVVQTVALRSFVYAEKHATWREAVAEVFDMVAEEEGFEQKSRSEIREMEADEQDAYFERYQEIQAIAEPRIEKEVTAKPVDVADFVDHIDYMVDLIGIDHVGISSDFDGGGGVTGWEDASETFNVTLELVRRGYTEEEIEKIWSGNLLRVLDEVQAKAAEIQTRE